MSSVNNGEYRYLLRPSWWWALVAVAWRTYPWPKAWRRFRAQTYGVDRLWRIPVRDSIRYVEWCRRYDAKLSVAIGGQT